MTDLIEFLRARLDEDEQIARSAGGRAERVWAADVSGKDPLGEASWPAVVRYATDGRLRGAVAHLPVMEERSEDRMTHIARHDPARVLAEVEAKRRIAFLAERVPALTRKFELFDNSQDAWAEVLKQLAHPYAAHPDYRPEWTPTT